MGYDEALKQLNKCLIIDLQSYPRVKLPYETGDGIRPELCMGTDNYHTPDKLVNEIISIASKYSIETALNSPFFWNISSIKTFW